MVVWLWISVFGPRLEGMRVHTADLTALSVLALALAACGQPASQPGSTPAGAEEAAPLPTAIATLSPSPTPTLASRDRCYISKGALGMKQERANRYRWDISEHTKLHVLCLLLPRP